MFQIDSIRYGLETIANQAINLSAPETIEQGIDNLKGLKILVDSTLRGNLEQFEDSNAPKAEHEPLIALNDGLWYCKESDLAPLCDDEHSH